MTEGHDASESVSSERQGEPVRLSLLSDLKRIAVAIGPVTGHPFPWLLVRSTHCGLPNPIAVSPQTDFCGGGAGTKWWSGHARVD